MDNTGMVKEESVLVGGLRKMEKEIGALEEELNKLSTQLDPLICSVPQEKQEGKTPDPPASKIVSHIRSMVVRIQTCVRRIEILRSSIEV